MDSIVEPVSPSDYKEPVLPSEDEHIIVPEISSSEDKCKIKDSSYNPENR